MEHVATGEFYCDGTEQKDSSVYPENWRDGSGEPVVDVVVVSVDVTGGFRVEEEGHEAHEEHEDGAHKAEEAQAIGGEALTGTALRAERIVAVVIVAATTCALEVATIWRAPSMAAIVFFGAVRASFNIGGRDDGWQESHLKALGKVSLLGMLAGDYRIEKEFCVG